MTAAPGMLVNAKRDIDDITAQNLVVESVDWGMRERDAAGVVESILGRLRSAIEDEARASRGTPPSLVELLSWRDRTLHDAMGERATVSGTVARMEPVRPVPEPTWVHPYRRDDGTPVRGHWRQIPASEAGVATR